MAQVFSSKEAIFISIILDLIKDYKTAIGQVLGVDASQISLFRKGRIGLYAILQALDLQEGEEIILPGFTCVVVPNAIIYCKAKPIYVDIDPQTFTIDPQLIAAKITKRTRAILVQNTFGLTPDLNPIIALARKHQLAIIEDNTHGFGSTYRGEQSGLLGDAAFFSTQWNKPFSTGIGGFVMARNPQLIEKIKQFESQLPPPGASTNRMLALQIRFRQQLTTSRWYWPAIRTYRWLSKHNIISGSSAGEELEGTIMPKDFLMAASEVQAKEGLRQLSTFGENIKHRRRLADFYQNAMQELGLPPVYEPDYAQHSFLKYSFFVKDRPRFLDLAAQHHIPLSDWFLSPLHPIQQNLERWQYPLGICPIAEKLGTHILNLPTEPGISLEEAHRIVAFLKRYKAELCSVEACLTKPMT